jgi:excisionase family DNA binding protein
MRSEKREVRSANGERVEVPTPPGITITATLRLLTRTELAEALRVSPRTVDRMQAEGEITPVMLRGYLVRFYLPDVVRQLMARALVSKRGCARRLEPGETVRRSEDGEGRCGFSLRVLKSGKPRGPC